MEEYTQLTEEKPGEGAKSEQGNVKEEDWSYTQRSEGTKVWRNQIFDKTFRNTDVETRIVGCKNEEQWQKTDIGICD
jgi:hypothetical protein